MTNQLTALSPLDGRYHEKVAALGLYFSECALMKYRLHVEIEWLIFLCNVTKLSGTSKISETDCLFLRKLVTDFDATQGERVKAIEKTTNHDVKAIEYYIKEKIADNKKLIELAEFVHFGCTSEDINNTAYSLMIEAAVEAEILPALYGVTDTLYELAQENSDIAMLARTHGQPASPTTVGKEFINFVARLEREISSLRNIPYLAKFSGAVGNFNAHISAYPKLDWSKIASSFITHLGLVPNLYTAQIETHDMLAQQSDSLARINTILTDLSRDIWMYISYGFFKQKTKAGEVGSSTMPHKVNPIDFENAEGNFGLANALLRHFAEKLPISRMQRDLTDSTVFRNIGSALGYSLLAYTSLEKGLGKLELNEAALEKDLAENVEVLAEPVQTVLRKNKVSGAYEKLKELTRGRRITLKDMREFIKQLKIPAVDKKYLLGLTPSTYTGIASKLCQNYKRLI